MASEPTTSNRLRKQFSAAADADASIEALLVEACRISDRLDKIAAFESGKSDWYEVFKFRMGDDQETVHVSINGVLSEARQQANTLRALITTLAQAQPVKSAVPTAKNPLDELARRREGRAHA